MELRIDRLSNAILKMKPGGEMQVVWNEKGK